MTGVHQNSRNVSSPVLSGVSGKRPKCQATSDSNTISFIYYYLAPGGGCEVLFSPGLSLCLSVCVCVCPANILVFYFSAIRRDIDLKFIQDTDRIVLKSLKKIDLHRSNVNVTGTVHCFFRVQPYHKTEP